MACIATLHLHPAVARRGATHRLTMAARATSAPKRGLLSTQPRSRTCGEEHGAVGVPDAPRLQGRRLRRHQLVPCRQDGHVRRAVHLHAVKAVSQLKARLRKQGVSLRRPDCIGPALLPRLHALYITAVGLWDF